MLVRVNNACSVCQLRVDAKEGVQTVAELRAENQTLSDRNTQVRYMFLLLMFLCVQKIFGYIMLIFVC
jgi:hypothetical protein